MECPLNLVQPKTDSLAKTHASSVFSKAVIFLEAG